MDNNIPVDVTKEEAQAVAEMLLTPSDGRSQGEYYEDLFTPIKKQSKSVAPDDVSSAIGASIDPEEFSRYYFNQTLFSNQVDIVNAIMDKDIPQVQVVEPRQAGKTSSIAVASAMALEFNAMEFKYTNPNEPYRVGVFAPKLGQGQIDLNRVKQLCERNRKAHNFINWNASNAGKIVWHNGSELHAVSASDQAETEGQTFNLIIMEEAQNISDYAVSEKILPMGGATNAKIVKVGTVRAVRNHFYRGWHEASLGFHKVSHTWTTCPNLTKGGAVIEAIVNGDLLRLSKYVMGLMPLSIKQALFPSNPELWTSGLMEEQDFRTQYLLEWLETSGLFLSAKNREDMIGTHELQLGRMGQELLVAGVDFAGVGEDETSVSVFRVTPTKVKEKIWGMTWMGSDDTVREVLNALHPQYGKFRCQKVCGDVTGIGEYAIKGIQQAGLYVEPINFGATEPDSQTSGLAINYKNAMCLYAKIELDNGRFKYAQKKNYVVPELNVNYHKGLNQWSNLEVESTGGMNKKIHHPSGDHDDIVMSDVLAIWASKTERTILAKPNQLNNIRVALAYPGGRR